MKKIKSLAAVFLALFILAAIPTQAFAAETHEGVATMHTQQWRLDHYDTTYIPIDDETHLKTVYPVYYCTVSGCTNSYLGNGASSTVSHTMSSYSYTGNNYHSGSLHYVRYEHSCLQCGRTTGYWDHYSCPGNGHCILPQSVFPVLTDK